MYLARLHRYNGLLNNVVTFLDDYGRAEAKRADAEIAAGKYKGPLHGIPWGAKDIISVKGYKTTWGSAPFKDQVLDYDASVVEQLRDAGAVLIAKVTTGELAQRRQLVWRADQEPVGSDAGLERIVRRAVVGDRGRLRRVRHRHRDERIDSQPVGALRPRRTASDVRPRQPLRRDGAVVDAGSSRPDLPLCGGHRDRDAGDREARRPRHERDGHAVQLERAASTSRRCSVGYHQGVVRRDHQCRRRRRTPSKMLATLQVARRHAVHPDQRCRVHDRHRRLRRRAHGVLRRARARRPHEGHARRRRRPTATCCRRVDYLQAQRAAHDDDDGACRRPPRTSTCISWHRTTPASPAPPRPAGAARKPPRPPQPERPQSPTQRHFGYANLAGYPAINVPNGFGETGSPTNAVIYAQPYPRARDHRAGEGVSGRGRLPPEEADEAGSGDDDASAVEEVLRSFDVGSTIVLRANGSSRAWRSLPAR